MTAKYERVLRKEERETERKDLRDCQEESVVCVCVGGAASDT